MSKKNEQGTWVRLDPNTRSLLKITMGAFKKSITQYVSELIEDDLAEKLSAIEGLGEALDGLKPGLADGLKQLNAKVALRKTISAGNIPAEALGEIEKEEEEEDESYEPIDLPK